MGLRVAILAGLAILGIVLLCVWLVAPSVFAEARGLLDGERLETLMARAGLWGPVLIIALMTVAVVASPIPSAPIALAAGAAYGHVWGTVQVVIGAELGALIAFAQRAFWGTMSCGVCSATASMPGFSGRSPC